MQKADCIVLSNTKNLELYGHTCRTVNSLDLSEDDVEFNITIMESNKNRLDQGFVYKHRVVTPDTEFGYNSFLNIGLEYCHNDWVIVANNDLAFSKNWFTKIMDVYKDNQDIKSFSPWNPLSHPNKVLDIEEFITGYEVAKHLTGWCIVIHKDVIKECKLFDPRFIFWYQDDDLSKTYQKYDIKHALVTSSKVYHFGESSHTTLKEKRKNFTFDQEAVFKEKWDENFISE